MILQGSENSSPSGQEDFLRELDVNSEVAHLEEHAESQTSLSGSIQTAQTSPQTENLWTCHDCGWTFPNSHPSAKQRRNHRKNCKFKSCNIRNSIGQSPVAGSSDEASSDEEEHQQTEHSNWRHQGLQGPKEEQIDSLSDWTSNSSISVDLCNPLEYGIQNTSSAENGVPNNVKNDESANEFHCNLDPQNQQHSILESSLLETSQLMTDEANVERTAEIIPEDSVTRRLTDSEKGRLVIQDAPDSSCPALITSESNECSAPQEGNLLGLSAELQYKIIAFSEESTSVQNLDAHTFSVTGQGSVNSLRETEQTHLTKEIPVQNTVKGSREGSEVDATQHIASAMSWSACSSASNEVLFKAECEDGNGSNSGKEPSIVHLPIYEKRISSISNGDALSVSGISEDLWTCCRCGRTSPNSHPSAKYRRNHRKHCGQYKGFEKVNSLDVAGNGQGSCDEVFSDDEKHMMEGLSYTGHQTNSPTLVAGINDDSYFKELEVMVSEDSSKAQGVEVSDLDISLGNTLNGQDNGLAILVANAEKELFLPHNTSENTAEGSSQECNEKFHARIEDEKKMQDGHSQKQLEGFRDIIAKAAEVKDQPDSFCKEAVCTNLDAAQQIEPMTVIIGAAEQTHANHYVVIGLIEPSPHEEAEAVELPITEPYSSNDVNADHEVGQPLSLVEVCRPSLSAHVIFTADALIEGDPKLENSIKHTHFLPVTEDGTRAEGSLSFPLSITMDKQVLSAQLLQLNPAHSNPVIFGLERPVSLGEENTRSTINEPEITDGSRVHPIDLHSLDFIVDPGAFGYQSPRAESSDGILLMNDNFEGARNSFQQGRTPELWEQLLDAELEKKDLNSRQQNIPDHLLLLSGDLQPEAAEKFGLPGEPNLHPEQMGSLYMQENLYGPPSLQPASLESTFVEATVDHGMPDKVISSMKPSLQHFQAPSFQTLVSDEYRLEEQQQPSQAQLMERMDNANSTSSNLFTLDWEVFDSSQDQSNNSTDSCARTQKAGSYPFASSNTSYDALEYRKSDTDDYQGISKVHTPLKFLLAEDSGSKALTETKDNAPSVKHYAPSPKSNPLIKRVLDKVMSSPVSFSSVKPSRDKPKVNSKWSACICCSTMN